jgi:ABC-type uncharacterized transport system permease subunit
MGVLGALVGLIVGARAGHSFSSAILGLLAGVLGGALFGAFTAITFSPQVAVAIGIAVVLALWPGLAAQPIISGDYDWEALKARYWPGLAVETAQETIEMLQAAIPEMPSRPGGGSRT